MYNRMGWPHPQTIQGPSPAELLISALSGIQPV